MERYYINTDFNFGDLSVEKFALVKVDDQEETEEVVCWGKYEDLNGNDNDEKWDAIDEYIKSELGFLPEYEIN